MPNSFAPVYDSFYGQRSDERRSAPETWLRNRLDAVTAMFRTRRSRLRRFVRQVDGYAADAAAGKIDPEQLRLLARRAGIHDEYLARAFALIREVADRELGLRHFDMQLLGGWAMMRGMVAEMDTGQGKTLTATLAAGSAAIAGFPAHVITVNEYLAERDADWMRPVYEALGLTVSVVVNRMSPEEKRAAYGADVVYTTNKQVAFDYLRDRIEVGMRLSPRQLKLESLYEKHPTGEKLLLRGLYFGIVDEADSILIDEAVTPLIISASAENSGRQRAYQKALEIARQMDPAGYRLHGDVRAVELTAEGLDYLEELGERQGGLWKSQVLREELVSHALRALYLFHRDRQYLVADGKVQIIDEFTGRVMPDRSWEGGLHQMIELKEGCEMSGDKETMARISYQRFFRRYLNLAGMTGTADEVRGEIRKVYRMDVLRIPPAQKIRRRVIPDEVYRTADAKWAAVVERVRQVHAGGRPILIGTRSVEASEHLSALLNEQGIEHQLLNARQDVEEAAIVAEAGKRGRVMVATNMAGRGTDIKLDDEVRELGGLYVIMTERHDSRRIDRQLFGRCGRQGDPGTATTFVSLEDELVSFNMPSFLRGSVSSLAVVDNVVGRLLARFMFHSAQRVVQSRQYRARGQVLKMDERHGDMLAFTGNME